MLGMWKIEARLDTWRRQHPTAKETPVPGTPAWVTEIVNVAFTATFRKGHPHTVLYTTAPGVALVRHLASFDAFRGPHIPATSLLRRALCPPSKSSTEVPTIGSVRAIILLDCNGTQS